jgi:ATP-dependent DNA helicase 2 subunit 2
VAKRLKPSPGDSGDGGNEGSGIPNILWDHVPDRVGSTDPARDFKAMISHRGEDLVEKAIQGMTSMVQELINNSIGDQYYGKVLDCLVALRSGCVAEEESSAFNTLLRNIKNAHGHTESNRRALWTDYIVKKGISLIDEDESDDSTVSKEEASRFLREDAVAAPIEPAPSAAPIDADDLFGDAE